MSKKNKIHTVEEIKTKGYLPIRDSRFYKGVTFTLDSLLDNVTTAMKRELKIKKKGDVMPFLVGDDTWQWFFKVPIDQMHHYEKETLLETMPSKTMGELQEEGLQQPIHDYDELLKQGYVSAKTSAMDAASAEAMKHMIAKAFNVDMQYVYAFRTGENTWDLFIKAFDLDSTQSPA